LIVSVSEPFRVPSVPGVSIVHLLEALLERGFVPSPGTRLRTMFRIFEQSQLRMPGYVSPELFIVRTAYPTFSEDLEQTLREEKSLQIAGLFDLLAFTHSSNFTRVDTNQTGFGIIAFEPTKTGKKVTCAVERWDESYEVDIDVYDQAIDNDTFGFLATRPG
jgi:hypothetical protein